MYDESYNPRDEEAFEQRHEENHERWNMNRNIEDEYQEFEVPTLAPVDTTMSPTIGKLAGALAKAQGMMTGAVKDSTNPFFKSSYADLASVIESGREALSKNGLAVIQTNRQSDIGVVVITTLAHESGEWIRGELNMRPVKSDPQGIGSCITYARRYSLSAIIGTAQVDDDGNQASGKDKKPVAVVEPDPDAIASLSECDTVDALAEHWKALTPAQRKSVGKDRLDGFKKRLTA
jgi:hypothetical protein